MSQAGGTVTQASRFLLGSLARRDEPELLDGAHHDPVELAANFRDIRRVNRLLGGVSTTMRYIPKMVEALPAGRPVRILDLATGSGDIPLAILRWARKQGRDVEIVASDIDESILDLARAHIGSLPEITFAQYDARDVPLPDRSFDIVHCALSLHHFDPDEAVRVLSEMNRLARQGFILNDLKRSRLGYAAAWVAARLTTRNRLTRNDAPLSVLRAYTPQELAGLLDRAGVEDVTIATHPWFRMVAVKRRENADA